MSRDIHTRRRLMRALPPGFRHTGVAGSQDHACKCRPCPGLPQDPERQNCTIKEKTISGPAQRAAVEPRGGQKARPDPELVEVALHQMGTIGGADLHRFRGFVPAALRGVRAAGVEAAA